MQCGSQLGHQTSSASPIAACGRRLQGPVSDLRGRAAAHLPSHQRPVLRGGQLVDRAELRDGSFEDGQGGAGY
eukprot:4805116-Pyramimonas_sp.AAC.1